MWFWYSPFLEDAAATSTEPALHALSELAPGSTFEMKFFKLNETTAARRRILFYMVDATDGSTPETGLTFAASDIKISKNNAAEANSAGTVTEIGGGVYSYEATAGEVDTLGDLSVRCTKAGTARQFPAAGQVLSADLYDAVRLGLTALPNAAAEAAGGLYTRGSGAGQINQNANGQVDSRTVAMSNNVVTAAAIATDAIDADAIADNAIDAGSIATGAITNTKFAAGAIDATVVADNTIDAGAIATGAITSTKFAAGAIDSAAIATDAIGSAELSAAAANKIRDTILSDATTFAGANINATISSRAVPGDQMNLVNGAITTAKFAAGAIDATVVADNTIDAGAIAAGAITSAKFAAGAIDSTAIATDAIGAAELSLAAAQKVRDTILSDATTFAGANINATISSRATQAQILSDATPFAGANIDAAISSRASSAALAVVGGVVAQVQLDTDDIQTRLPTALVNGRMLVTQALVAGTADSGTTTTMVDAARTEADNDYWKGSWLVFKSGNVANQIRLITGFNAATDTFTFTPATTQAIATQDYEILPAAAVDVALWASAVVSALIAGRVDVSVGAMAANVLTASALATSAVDEIVDQVWDEARAGHVAAGTFGEGVASVVGSVGSVAAGGIVASSFAAGAIDSTALANNAITAAKIATDAIDSDAVAPSAVTEIQAGLATAAALVVVDAAVANIQTRLPAGLVSGRIDASVGAMANNVLTSAALATSAVDEIVDQVWDEAIAGHLGVGSTGEALSNAGGSAATDWTAAERNQIRFRLSIDGVQATPVTAAGTFASVDGRLPATLSSGRMRSQVEAMDANTLTASALAADAVTEIQTGLATASALATVQTSVSAVGALVATLNNLSIADVQAALTAQGYTIARAALLSNLNASVSSVLTAIAALNNVSAADVWNFNLNTGFSLSQRNLAGGALLLSRMMTTNRLEEQAGSPGNMRLFLDDAATVGLTWVIRPQTGDVTGEILNAPARRAGAT